MFSDCNKLKLATNNEKIPGKFLNIQKLNYILIKNPSAQKYLNKFTIFNKHKSTKILLDSAETMIRRNFIALNTNYRKEVLTLMIQISTLKN